MADMASHTVTVDVPAMAGTAIVLRAPLGKNGGALTVSEITAVNKAATSSTVSWQAVMVKLSADGGTVMGTVATIGGSAASGDQAHWAVNTPKRSELAYGACVLDAGQMLAVIPTAVTTGTATNAQIIAHYQVGK